MDHYPSRSGFEFERRVVDALVAALTEIFGSEICVRDASGEFASSASGHRLGGAVVIEMLGKALLIFVEVKREVYPRDIRNAVWKLNKHMHISRSPYESVCMLAAASLSPGARSELKALNIASFELGGSLYLKHDGWFINIEKPPRRPQKTNQDFDLFTDARESVVHVLLMNSFKWLTGTELAEQAQTSPYTCSLVLQELTLREWVESTGGGPSKRRMLKHPEELLDAWVERWRARKEKKTKWYTFVENPRHMLACLAERINQQGVDFPWAFTGTAAANIVAPLLTSTEDASIIVPSGCTEAIADALGLIPVDKGGNVTLIEREPSKLLYRSKHPDHPAFFASVYILYLDLLDGRGRNKELAGHLRGRLKSLWEKK